MAFVKTKQCFSHKWPNISTSHFFESPKMIRKKCKIVLIRIIYYHPGHATNQIFKDCSDIDTAIVTLKYPGGAMACLELCRESGIGCYYYRVEVSF